MEPFTIQCATCQSRIRVRDPDLIHQIVKCPKCDSMIQIELPPRTPFAASPGPSVDSTALTKDGFAASEVSAATMQPPPPTQDDDDELRLADVDEQLEHANYPATSWEPEAPPLIPSDEWTSAGTAKTRQYLLIACLGLSGIAVAGLLFFLFLRWYSSAEADVIAADPAALVRSQVEPERDNTAAASDAIEEREDAADAVPQADPSAEAPAATEREIPTLPNSPSVDPSSDAVANREEDSESDATGDGALLPGQPDGADELPASLSDSETTSADENQPAELELPQQLQFFSPIISYNLQPTLPDTDVVPTEAPLTAEEMGLAPAASDALTSTVDVKARMQVELPGIIIGDRPLAQLFNLLTHVSGIPTVVDLDSLAAGGIDRAQKARFHHGEPIPVGELIDEITRSVGVVVTAEENSALRIAAPINVIRETLPETISLKGLADSAEDIQWLQQTLTQLFPDTQPDWRIENGELAVDMDAIAGDRARLMRWFHTLRLVENWRHLADPTSKGAGLPVMVWRQPFVDPQSLTVLDSNLQQLFAQAMPVGQIISRTCAEAGLACWIDWANVASGGLSPDAMQVVVTHNRPLRRVLSDYATSYSLAVALVDEKTLWLTSPAAYRAQSQIYVLPSDGKTIEQWQQQLRLLTPVSLEGVGQLYVALTPDGRFAIVRCCRPAIRF